MKTVIAVILFGCLSTLTIAADTPALKADHKPDVTAQLLKVERDLNEAFKARDKNTLAALCAEDFVFTDDNGKLTTKAQFIKSMDSGFKVVSYTLSDLAVHVYGDTGIITGQWDGTVKADNEETKTSLRFTDTFVRRDERWWTVASQITHLIPHE